DHRDVVRGAQPTTPQRTHRTERHLVVRGDQTVEGVGVERLAGPLPRLLAEVTLDDGGLDPAVRAGGEEPVAPVHRALVAERTGQVYQASSAVDVDQVLGGLAGGRDVVDAHADGVGQVGEAPEQDDGHPVGDQVDDARVVGRRTGDDRAVDPAGAHDAVVGDLAVQLVRVGREDELQVALVDGVVDAGDHVHEVGVTEDVLGGVRHDQRDGADVV